MIDDQADPGPDPLSGRDPHPREQIDLWPLHDARQELLEEIVSQAGESPARTKVLLSVVGIAAALALVAGGAWAVTNDGSGNDGKNDDQVAAATSHDPSPTDVATDPTTAPTTEATTEETKEPRHRDEVRRNGVRIGNVYTLRSCLRRTLDHTRRVDQMPKVVKLERSKHKWLLYTVKDGRRYYAVEGACKWVRIVDTPRRRH